MEKRSTAYDCGWYNFIVWIGKRHPKLFNQPNYNFQEYKIKINADKRKTMVWLKKNKFP